MFSMSLTSTFVKNCIALKEMFDGGVGLLGFGYLNCGQRVNVILFTAIGKDGIKVC